MDLGGGRVGRAVGAALAQQGIRYVIVERLAERIRDPQHYVLGDAAELEVLVRAGINDCASVVITTHDDDMNVYLTLYCRRLRPDVQILARSNLERNVSTLHRAGADFVMSYASTGARSVFNLLKRETVLMLAEGLDVFRVPVPPALVGKSLAECKFRQTTGCNVIGVEENDTINARPNPHQPLSANAELIVVVDAESEQRFFETIKQIARSPG